MANNKKKQKKQKPGYFQQNVQQFGEDFLERKTARDVDRDAQKVFRDIAYQNPEAMVNIAPFFENRTFIANLANSANETVMKKYVHYSGICMFVTAPNNPVASDPRYNLDKYLVEAKGEYEAYSIITKYLNNIVSALNSGQDRVWVQAMILDNLRSMSAALKQYKYSI